MNLVTREQEAEMVPATWKHRFYDSYCAEWERGMQVVGEKLLALGDNFTADDVDRVIGYDSWTHFYCSGCGKKVEAVVFLDSGVCVCCTCSQGIHELFEGAKMNEAEKVMNELKDEVSSEVIEHLKYVILGLESIKSKDRLPRDRYLAIAVTEVEKLIAFVKMYC